MKELGVVYRNAQAELTIKPNPNRLEGRGNIMPDGPSRGPDQQPININLGSAGREATRRLEEMVRPRDQGEPQTPRAINVSVAVGAPETAPKIKTGNATWRNKDIDQPVRITGYLGKGPDGRDYVSIDGSATGVPLDEIQYSARKPRTPRIRPSGTPQTDQGATSQGPQVTPEQLNEELGKLDIEGVNINVRRAARDLAAEAAARGRQGNFSTEGITNGSLLAEAKTLERMISSGIADRDSLRAAYERIDKIDAPQAEKAVLLNNIAEAAYDMDAEIQSRRRENSFAEQSGQERYTEEQLLTDQKARDEVFNSFFADADATPSQQFREAFDPFSVGMQHRRFLRTIRQASTSGKAGNITLTTEQKNLLRADYQRYVKEHDIREALHNANYALYFPVKFEQLADSLQGFRSELGDYANRTAGVRQMMDLFEGALREDMAAHGGYLRQEAVLDRTGTGSPEEGFVVKRVKERFRQMWEGGQIFSRDQQGNSVDVRREKGKITDWEIDKIFSMARGMEIVSLRLLSLAAESKLPKGGIAQYTSLWLQDLLQGYSGYVHALAKYNITEKGLRPYLYNEDKIPRLMGILGTWDPKAAEKMWKDFQSDPRKVLDAPELNYLQRLNPNQCGDIFTWASWRFDNKDFTAASATQQFIINGRAKVYWRETHSNQPFPEGEDWDNWVASVPGALSEKAKIFWRQKYPGKDFPEGEDWDKWVSEIPQYNEYGKWIGTGLRFEKLRGDLAKLKSKDNKTKQEGETAFESAKQLMERIVDLQPQRLYLVSERIRGRLNLGMTPDEVSKALFGLSTMESTIYARREQLLSQGKTFDTLNLDDFYDVITDVGERELAKRFAGAVKADFNTNQEKYWQEFVHDREYTHGFVLWTGDVPVDEFNMVVLGDTGGYARRLRDNKAQTEAFSKEMDLLGNLGNIQEPEQLIAALDEVYKKIAEYDAPKAKNAIADKAIMLLKFYKEASFVDMLPVGGPLARILTKTSAAQLAYGKSAASWGPATIDSVLIQLRDKGRITDERFKEARETLLADKRDIGIEIGSALIQFMSLAIALYILQQLLKSETSPQH